MFVSVHNMSVGEHFRKCLKRYEVYGEAVVSIPQAPRIKRTTTKAISGCPWATGSLVVKHYSGLNEKFASR